MNTMNNKKKAAGTAKIAAATMKCHFFSRSYEPTGILAPMSGREGS